MVYFHHYSPPLRGIVEYAYIIFLPVSQLVLLRLEKVTSRKRESFCLFVFIYLFIYLFLQLRIHVRVTSMAANTFVTKQVDRIAIIKGPAKLLLRKFTFKIEVSVVLQITGHSKNGPLNRRNNFFFQDN